MHFCLWPTSCAPLTCRSRSTLWRCRLTGSRTATSGEVRLTKDLDVSLKGKHVILVEDIVDTGLTMNYLLGYLRGRGPLSVKVATLLSKPSRRQVEVPLDFVGFEIGDAFVYGYGLDVAHELRNLPFVTSQDD